MLLSFHIVAISILVVVVGNIAYHLGKKEGIRIASRPPKPPIEDDSSS